MMTAALLFGGGAALTMLAMLGAGWVAAVRDSRRIGLFPLLVMTCATPFLIGVVWGLVYALIRLAGVSS